MTRRGARRLVSGVLLLGTAALGLFAGVLAVVSIWHGWTWMTSRSADKTTVVWSVNDGAVWRTRVRYVDLDPGDDASWMFQHRASLPQMFGQYEWKPRVRSRTTAASDSFAWVLPLWVPGAVGIGIGMCGYALRRKHHAWMCEKCRYDLRGLKADRCPECGTVLPPQQT